MTGVSLATGNDGLVMVETRVHDFSHYGLNLAGSGDRRWVGALYANQYGVNAAGANTVVEGVEIDGNTYGIYVTGAGSVIRESVVHDNATWGIRVSGERAGEGNTVYGHRDSGEHGIDLSGTGSRAEGTWCTTTGTGSTYRRGLRRGTGRLRTSTASGWIPPAGRFRATRCTRTRRGSTHTA